MCQLECITECTLEQIVARGGLVYWLQFNFCFITPSFHQFGLLKWRTPCFLDTTCIISYILALALALADDLSFSIELPNDLNAHQIGSWKKLNSRNMAWFSSFGEQQMQHKICIEVTFAFD